MIAKLKGLLDEKTEDQVIVDVGGVGYGVHLSQLSLQRVPAPGEPVTFFIYSHVREDQFTLFGFESSLDKDVFEILLAANGIGPKSALSILSALEGIQILEGLSSGNKVLFSGISGVGKKTVEKMILELKEKAAKRLLVERGVSPTGKKSKSAHGAPEEEANLSADLEQALSSLGYRESEVRWMVREVLMQTGKIHTFDSALKKALQMYTSAFKTTTAKGNA